jgi:DNA invertase Pin-like site-specific DNA recombinase
MYLYGSNFVSGDTLTHEDPQGQLYTGRVPTLVSSGELESSLNNGADSGTWFQRLLVDVGEGKIDVVVVYKVDRLTRSLSDFAKIVEIFDKRNVSFVSVTQQFNTTTSMGRLTLNIRLSFAQFEREVTGERIRDKIAASKKKGMWMGGLPSLGYDIKDERLAINQAEANTIRHIFQRYTELKSVRPSTMAIAGACDEHRFSDGGYHRQFQG